MMSEMLLKRSEMKMNIQEILLLRDVVDVEDVFKEMMRNEKKY